MRSEASWPAVTGLSLTTVSCYVLGNQLTADSDDNPYPKRFLLLGMLLFKDILPILAVDHPGSMLV